MEQGKIIMKTNEKVSNYIKLCNEWAEKFLQMDKEELKKRLENRKTESQEKILARFKTAYQEIRSPVWSPPG